MSEVYFIGDTHFGHKGIIQFSETKPFRPFETIEEHDAELVKRWNIVVKPKDTVWHLGDAVFGRRNLTILAKLNGYKRFVMGNHDIYGAEEYLKYFATLHGTVEYKGMVLSHAPLHESQLKRWYLNIHGHLHTKTIDNPKYINVSCEQINLTPIPLEMIFITQALKLKIRTVKL